MSINIEVVADKDTAELCFYTAAVRRWALDSKIAVQVLSFGRWRAWLLCQPGAASSKDMCGLAQLSLF